MNAECKLFCKRITVVLLATTSLALWVDAIVNQRRELVWVYIAIFATWAISALVWTFLPLFRKKQTRNASAAKISRLLMSLTLGFAILLWPTQSSGTTAVPRYENVVTVQSYEDGTYEIVSVRGKELSKLAPEKLQLAVEKEFAKVKRKAGEPEVQTVTLLEGVIILIIFIAVVAALCYTGYMLYKAIKGIGEKRDREQKKIDDDEEKSQSSGGDGITCAASFYLGTAPTMTGSYPFDGVEPFVVTFEVYADGTMVGVDSAAIGGFSENAIAPEEYRTKRGLSTNLFVDSFSSNGIPVEVSPIPITVSRADRHATIAYEGATNRTYTFQRSTNLVAWVTQGKLSSPYFTAKRNIISFLDGLNPRTECVFYRVLVEK